MCFTVCQILLPMYILLHFFINHYAPGQNPCLSFPVTRIMPISSLRPAWSPPPCHMEVDGNNTYFLVQTDYVGSVTQNDAAGATHMVTNTPPGPSSHQTNVLPAAERLQQIPKKIPSPFIHRVNGTAPKTTCLRTPRAFTLRLWWNFQFKLDCL